MKRVEIDGDLAAIRNVFSDVLLDNIVEPTADIISWKNYKPGIAKILYSREYERLKNERQYSYILSNKGLIQLYFKFDADILMHSKMAYYPHPVLLRETKTDIENYFWQTDDETISEYYYDLNNILESECTGVVEVNSGNDENSADSISIDQFEDLISAKYKMSNTSHIRFDYDSKVSSHNKFEIQYSSINTIRIPIAQIISPFLFMDFIVRNEIQEWYNKTCRTIPYSTAFSVARKKSRQISGFSYNNIHCSHLNK